MTPSAVETLRPSIGSGSAIRRVLAPSYSDLLFIAMIMWLFVLGEDAWSRLLVDGDTGWHIRVGEHILDGKGIPQTDFFSLTKFGQTWYAWEWGADVIYAWLYRTWGLKGVVLLSGAQISLFAVLLARFMVWRGANPMIMIALTMLAAGAGSLHYLARPHLFTLMMLPIAIWLIERDRRRNDWLIWTLIPGTAIWTNLHGGFMALIACLGLLVIAEAMAGNRHGALRYTMAGAGCGLATLINPYGYHLHEHVLAYLQSDWIKDVVEEFQSPRFRSENLMQFELLLLLGVMAAAAAASRREWVYSLWILFWAHQSLVSVRHATVFVTIASPVIAVELTRLWRQWTGGVSRKSLAGILDSMSNDMAPSFRWTSVWPVGFLAALLFLDGGSKWPQDFPTLRFPVKTIDAHAAKLRGQRVFTTDEWADYLLFKFYPDQRVFFDGRSDFYGPSVGKEYIRLTGGGYDWKQLMAKHDFRVALLPPDVAIATLLKTDPDWRVVADDGKAIVFERIGGLPKTTPSALMKSVPSDELPKGVHAANGRRVPTRIGDEQWN